MGLINIDFNEAITKSNIIAERGTNVMNIADTLIGYEGLIAKAWKGDCSCKYITKYDKHANSLKKHGKELKENADKLKKSAERLKDVDEWGKILFSH